MTSKRGQQDVILDQSGVQNGIKIGLGGTPAEGSRTKSKKRRPGVGKGSSSRSTSGPQNRHVCTFWRHFFYVFSRLFFDWFFNGFLVDFSTIFGLFFNDFSCFVRCFFEVVFLMIFYGIFDRSLDCVNLKIIEISLVFIPYFVCIRHFLQTIDFYIDFLSMSRPFSHRFFINFHDFLGIDFRIEL